MHSGPRARRRGDGWRAAIAVAPLNDLLIEPPRLRLGKHAKLPPQRGGTGLVLAERGAVLSAPGVVAHEPAMAGLAQGIERDELEGDRQRRLAIFVAREHALEGAQRQAAQPFPLGVEPLLERLLADCEP